MLRASILAWSALSGIVVGVFADILLAALWAITTTLVPSLNGRVPASWARPACGAVLLLIPLLLGIVGFLEGRLKA